MEPAAFQFSGNTSLPPKTRLICGFFGLLLLVRQRFFLEGWGGKHQPFSCATKAVSPSAFTDLNE